MIFCAYCFVFKTIPFCQVALSVALIFVSLFHNRRAKNASGKKEGRYENQLLLVFFFCYYALDWVFCVKQMPINTNHLTKFDNIIYAIMLRYNPIALAIVLQWTLIYLDRPKKNASPVQDEKLSQQQIDEEDDEDGGWMTELC